MSTTAHQHTSLESLHPPCAPKASIISLTNRELQKWHYMTSKARSWNAIHFCHILLGSSLNPATIPVRKSMERPMGRGTKAPNARWVRSKQPAEICHPCEWAILKMVPLAPCWVLPTENRKRNKPSLLNPTQIAYLNKVNVILNCSVLRQCVMHQEVADILSFLRKMDSEFLSEPFFDATVYFPLSEICSLKFSPGSPYPYLFCYLGWSNRKCFLSHQ